MQHPTCQRRTTAALSVIGLALLLPAAARAEDYTFTKIADDAEAISAFGFPSINTGGEVAFFAALDAGGEAIYIGTGDGILTTVAETGELYKQLFTPAINVDGRVVFQATTVLASFPDKLIADNGIYSSKEGSTITIADNQPGSPYFDFGTQNRPSINASGTVAFFGQLRTPDGFPSLATGVYTGVGGAHTTIADFSNGLSPVSEGTTINATGTVAFTANRQGSGARSVFTGMSAASTTVADADDGFSAFGITPSINDQGAVAFDAFLEEGGSGVYTGGTQAVLPVVETEDGEFTAFENPAINNDGTVAFAATRTGGVRGIFTGDDPAADKVIAIGDEIFDSTLAGFLFSRSLNDNGEIAFLYRTGDGVRGIAVASPGALTRTIFGGDGYNGVRARSAEGGDTVAQLRGGVAGDERSVAMSYEPGGTFSINGGRPVGDALSLSGTESDVFVLELAYSDEDLATAGITNENAFFLQWRDPADDAWKNAVLGNTPSGGVAFPGASYDAYLAALGGVFSLGDYGNDPASNTVWAVLNHNSLFAIAPVPDPSVPGDYSQNGMVDAADYVLWRNNFGSDTALPNDDTAGVGPDDYTRWKTHFGQTAGSGSAIGASEGNAAVPEPATAGLALVGLLGLARRRNRGRSPC